MWCWEGEAGAEHCGLKPSLRCWRWADGATPTRPTRGVGAGACTLTRTSSHALALPAVPLLPLPREGEGEHAEGVAVDSW